MIKLIQETKKKAFTLIELLIVVAIIGILAGVGVPMYNGYMASAKVESAKTNHSNLKSFMAATITKCSTLGGTATVKVGSATARCNYSASSWASVFTTYANALNKNPYGGNSAARTSSSSTVGQNAIYYSGTKIIRLRTRVQDTGTTAEQYMPSSGYDEIQIE